jgi:hypothetical protein
MIRISKQTRLKPEDIIFKAAKFFGKKGEQLEEKERNPCCISFEGSGGYVSISIVDEGRTRTVDAETREFEYQVKRFLERL